MVRTENGSGNAASWSSPRPPADGEVPQGFRAYVIRGDKQAAPAPAPQNGAVQQVSGPIFNNPTPTSIVINNNNSGPSPYGFPVGQVGFPQAPAGQFPQGPAAPGQGPQRPGLFPNVPSSWQQAQGPQGQGGFVDEHGYFHSAADVALMSRRTFIYGDPRMQQSGGVDPRVYHPDPQVAAYYQQQQQGWGGSSMADIPIHRVGSLPGAQPGPAGAPPQKSSLFRTVGRLLSWGAIGVGAFVTGVAAAGLLTGGAPLPLGIAPSPGGNWSDLAGAIPSFIVGPAFIGAGALGLKWTKKKPQQ